MMNKRLNFRLGLDVDILSCQACRVDTLFVVRSYPLKRQSTIENVLVFFKLYI